MYFITLVDNKFFYFSIAFVMHILILLIFIITLQSIPPTYKIGDERNQIMSSYLYQMEKLPANQTQKMPSRPREEIPMHAKTDIVKHDSNTKKMMVHSANKQIRPASLNSELSQGQAVPELIALLHAAIQKQQQYPPSALQMEREGRVTLKFILYSNGQIESLRIGHSSGTSSLDEAALDAVRHATPFAEASKYLHEPQEYSIDVVFELT